VYQFNPPRWNGFWRYLRRMHDKLVIVDDEHLVVGDRNLFKVNFGLGDQNVSRDVYLKGEVAKRAQAYVDQFIQHRDVVPWKTRNFSAEELKASFTRLMDIASRRHPLFNRDVDHWENLVKPIQGRVQFLHDPVGKPKGIHGVAKSILEAIDSTRHELLIENPYIVLTKEFQNALRKAAERGVKIRVITNSRESQAGALIHAGWEKSRAFLNEIGAEIWEMKAPKAKGRIRSFLKRFRQHLFFKSAATHLHAKTMVCDKKTAFVMSYNFDPRSQKLNSEVGVKIEDQIFAKELRADILGDLRTGFYKKVAKEGALISGLPRSNCIMRLSARLFHSQL
jgi:putative cardiolipin synthase